MSYLDGTTLFQVGSRGSDVAQIQTALNNRGYAVGAVDGIFGAKTKEGVMRLQSDKGLSIDGIVGPQAWAALMGGNVSAPMPSIVPVQAVPSAPSRLVVATGKTGSESFGLFSSSNMSLILGGLGLLTIGTIALSKSKRKRA